MMANYVLLRTKIESEIKKMGSNMVEIILYILLTESMALNFLK